MSIKDNINSIKRKIAEHARASNRDPSDVTLMGVTKTVDIRRIKEASESGLRDFGENYAQEFRDKYNELGELNNRINWHFIGSLQKNKVKYLVGKVVLIHSVDRLPIAEEISKRYQKEDISASVLIEVNNGEEETKEGVKIDDVERLLTEINKLANIEVKGFMTMAPYYDDPENARPLFREMKRLQDSLSGKYRRLTQLSMGMSNDYHVAVEEGSTIVRIGSAIFGERIYT